jgi:hypothetical protein
MDQPSIGILLCHEANRVIAEYALRDMTKPMAVSTYLTRALPAAMREALPPVEEIEREFVSATITGAYTICGSDSDPGQDDGDESAE